MWRHVSNVPEFLGTLETCRHIRVGPLTGQTHQRFNHSLRGVFFRLGGHG
jgi:hypothetical protein